MGYKILLADDSVTIQKVVELTFADDKNYEVLALGDGDQAKAKLADFHPDLVIADVVMPGATGYDLCEHIKNTPSLSHISVMLLRGTFEPFDQARADAARNDDIIVKPFESAALVKKVKALLEKSGAQPHDEALPPKEAAPVARKASGPFDAPAAAPVDAFSPFEAPAAPPQEEASPFDFTSDPGLKDSPSAFSPFEAAPEQPEMDAEPAFEPDEPSAAMDEPAPFEEVQPASFDPVVEEAKPAASAEPDASWANDTNPYGEPLAEEGAELAASTMAMDAGDLQTLQAGLQGSQPVPDSAAEQPGIADEDPLGDSGGLSGLMENHVATPLLAEESADGSGIAESIPPEQTAQALVEGEPEARGADAATGGEDVEPGCAAAVVGAALDAPTRGDEAAPGADSSPEATPAAAVARDLDAADSRTEAERLDQPVVAPEQPVAASDEPGEAPAPAADEALIEQIVQRVLERLTTDAIRELAKDLVPSIAERLISEKLSELDSSD